MTLTTFSGEQGSVRVKPGPATPVAIVAGFEAASGSGGSSTVPERDENYTVTPSYFVDSSGDFFMRLFVYDATGSRLFLSNRRLDGLTPFSPVEPVFPVGRNRPSRVFVTVANLGKNDEYEVVPKNLIEWKIDGSNNCTIETNINGVTGDITIAPSEVLSASVAHDPDALLAEGFKLLVTKGNVRVTHMRRDYY